MFDDKLKMALAKIKESEEAMKKDLERVWLPWEGMGLANIYRERIFVIEIW